MIGGREQRRVAEHDQRAVRRARHEPHGGLEHVHAGPLRADQSPRDVEAVLGQQLVEVVARHAPGDVGELVANEVGHPVAQVAQPPVDLAAATALGHDPGELLVAGRADRHAGAVVERDLERLDVVAGLARHQRVGAAGVVADHPAEGAVGVGGGIGPVGQAVLLGGVAELVADHARAYARAAALGIELDDLVHQLRVVEDDGHVHRLSARAGAAAARQDRRAVAAAGRDRGDHVGLVARHDETERDVAVEREVVRVEGAGARVEADLAANVALELALEGPEVDPGRSRDGLAPPVPPAQLGQPPARRRGHGGLLPRRRRCSLRERPALAGFLFSGRGIRHRERA